MAKSSKPSTEPWYGTLKVPGNIKVNIRIGDKRKGGSAADMALRGAGLLNDPAIKKLQGALEARVKLAAVRWTTGEINSKLSVIEMAIEEDLEKWSQIAISFATSQQSGQRGTLKIAPPETTGAQTPTFRTFIRAPAGSAPGAISWPSLDKKWWKRKGQKPFFMGLSRETPLKTQLETYLPDAYRDLFDPRLSLRVRINEVKAMVDGQKKTVAKQRFAVLTFSFSQANPAGALALQSLTGNAATDSAVISVMFKDQSDIVTKLENLGKGKRPKRPWVGAFARYWFLYRMTKVANTALNRHLGRLVAKEST